VTPIATNSTGGWESPALDREGGSGSEIPSLPSNAMRRSCRYGMQFGVDREALAHRLPRLRARRGARRVRSRRADVAGLHANLCARSAASSSARSTASPSSATARRAGAGCRATRRATRCRRGRHDAVAQRAGALHVGRAEAVVTSGRARTRDTARRCATSPCRGRDADVVERRL